MNENTPLHVSYLGNVREFMNGLRHTTFHSCANNGTDEKRKGDRTTLILVKVGFGTSKIINFYLFTTYNVFFVLTISY